MRRFELSEGKSNKFWQVSRDDASVTVCFGRIGTEGQTQLKSFASSTAAQSELDKLVKEKLKKGYSEVVAAGPAAASAQVASTAPAPAKPAKVQVIASNGPVATVNAAVPAPPVPTSVPRAPSVSTAPVRSIDDATPNAARREVDAIVWTDAALRAASPIRGRTLVPIRRPDAKPLYARLSSAMTAFGPMLDSGMSQVDAQKELMKRTRAAFAGPMPDVLEVETQAAAFALIGPKTAWSDTPRTHDFFGFWIAKGGALFTLRALVQALALRVVVDDKRLGLNPKAVDSPWFRTRDRDDWRGLRLAAALATDAEHDELLKEAEALVPNTTPEIRALFATAFERPEWSEADLASAVATGAELPAYFWPLLVALPSFEDVRALVARAPNVGNSVWYLAAALDAVRFDLVARYGAPSAELFCDVITRAGASGVERVRSLAEPLSLIVAPRVADFFVKQLATKELRAIAAAYLQSHPEVAVLPLAIVAAGKGPIAESARAVLKPLVVSAKDAVAVVKSALSPAAANVVAELEEQTRPRAEATRDELPALLRTPPWTTKVKVAAPTIVQLSPLPFIEVMVWKLGEQEAMLTANRWLDERPDSAIDNVAKVRAASDSMPTPTERSWNLTSASIFTQLPKKDLLELLPSLNLARFNWAYHKTAGVLVARHGVELIGLALHSASEDSLNAVEALVRACSPRVAPLMADAFSRLKKARASASEWLLAFPEAAAVGLIPQALAKPGRDRAAAESALRFVAARGHRAVIEAVASQYGPVAASGIATVLDFDPLQNVPTKLPKLPPFWSAVGFTRPLLLGGKKALTVPAVDALGTMLAFTSAEDPYQGIAMVKALCEPASLGDFAWDLFQAWMVAGAPSKEMWAFQALGLLGDDDCARKLTPLVRTWPGEAAHARAVIGLDVLARIGTDVALMHLHGIAQKLKFKGLQEKAREKIDQIAEARGLTAEELADRLVPDLGLDESGSLALDFGPRSFRVAFDETLKPFVLDEAGKRLPDLPKAKQTDDAEKSKQATDVWKALKKDAKTIATGQILRLEIAMCAQRRWPTQVFRQFLVEHPLLVHVVRRLVWGTFDETQRLIGSFRVTEDSSLASVTDAAYELAPDAQVGIVHRFDLDDSTAAAWGQLLADYELIQPFPQLAREVTIATEAERAAKTLDRVSGLTVPTGKVLGLDGRGWRRGAPQDGGVVCWYEKALPGGLVACLDLDPGIFTGMVSEAPQQKLGSLTLSRGEPGWGNKDGLALGELSPIPFSELLRDLESLRP